MKLKKKIVLLPGDGIGPEVARAAANVLQECAREFGHANVAFSPALTRAARWCRCDTSWRAACDRYSI